MNVKKTGAEERTPKNKIGVRNSEGDLLLLPPSMNMLNLLDKATMMGMMRTSYVKEKKRNLLS